MKKIIWLMIASVAISGVSFAELTVEQARSEKQLSSEGYSQATIDLVQKESGEYVPKKTTSKMRKKWYRLWNQIDPVSPEAPDAGRHQIKMYPSNTDY